MDVHARLRYSVTAMKNLTRVALAAITCIVMRADTLTLKDGQKLNGRFIAGDQNSIEFQSDRDNRTTRFRLSEISNVSFGPAYGQSGLYRDQTRTGGFVDSIPSGTPIEVRTNETIDRDRAGDGRIYTGVVERDVLDANGAVAIPRGAQTELIVRSLSDHTLALDMEAITVDRNRYIVGAEATQGGSRRDGVGANRRTGEYVGGGALLGTIIGALAGGGKGAAIGAGAGAAAGLGTEVLTKGSRVRIPAESIITFRLNRALQLGRGEYSQDPGYMQDGHHYHRDH